MGMQVAFIEEDTYCNNCYYAIITVITIEVGFSNKDTHII